MRLIDADALWHNMETADWYNNADRDEVAEPLVLRSSTIGGWISVKDRLPENSDTVLITHKGGVSFGWYNGRYWERGASTKHREIRTVSHWMPLPEPPEVEQDG